MCIVTFLTSPPKVFNGIKLGKLYIPFTFKKFKDTKGVIKMKYDIKTFDKIFDSLKLYENAKYFSDYKLDIIINNKSIGTIKFDRADKSLLINNIIAISTVISKNVKEVKILMKNIYEDFWGIYNVLLFSYTNTLKQTVCYISSESRMISIVNGYITKLNEDKIVIVNNNDEIVEIYREGYTNALKVKHLPLISYKQLVKNIYEKEALKQ
jgi:hypothetical protein